MLNLYTKGNATIIPAIVIPNSKKQSITLFENTLKIHITKPPVEGRANREIVEFLSKALKIKKKQISIIRGAGSKNKLIAIEDISDEELLCRLRPFFK